MDQYDLFLVPLNPEHVVRIVMQELHFKSNSMFTADGRNCNHLIVLSVSHGQEKQILPFLFLVLCIVPFFHNNQALSNDWTITYLISIM